MSLDVCIEGPPEEVDCRCSCCDHQHKKTQRTEYFSGNVTHNLTAMAESAGIRRLLWRPEELGLTKASQLIDPLTLGVRLLESQPERFKKLNPDNGWGSYEGLLEFARDYLEACKENPEGNINTWR